MSYDLMVFDPGAAPFARAEFLAWYEEQTQWSEPHGYNDPGITSPRLRAWYDEIVVHFPNLNGGGEVDFDSPRLADYSIGRSIIYVGFAWSEAEAAYRAARHIAERQGVGFFDVSADQGEIWRPR